MPDTSEAEAEIQRGLAQIRGRLDALQVEAEATDISDDEISRSAALADQIAQKLGWAPVVANATAILALAQIVGNVEDPDTALRALIIPFGCFASGLAFAVESIRNEGITHGRFAHVLRTLRSDRLARIHMVRRVAVKFGSVESDLSVEALAEMDQLITEAQEELAGLPGRAELKESVAKIKSAIAKTARYNGVSIFFLAAGFAFLLGGSGLGWLTLS